MAWPIGLKFVKSTFLLLSRVAISLAIALAWPAISAEQLSAVELKKQRFEQTTLPAVKRVHQSWLTRFETVKQLIMIGDPADQLELLHKRFGTDNDQQLLAALKPHPVSIVMAQAAIESGWGTSRFYREANNVFGVWSHSSDEPRIAAKGKRNGKTIWLKSYRSLDDSIRDYFQLLAKGTPYQAFRLARIKTDDPHKLIPYLTAYSERRSDYTKQVSQVLRQNQFSRFDSHQQKEK